MAKLSKSDTSNKNRVTKGKRYYICFYYLATNTI